MDYYLADSLKSTLEVTIEEEEQSKVLNFKWVHGDVSHLCGAIVERCSQAAVLTCPLCNCIFQSGGKPRDLIFQHLQEVHFSYEYGCVYRCTTCKSQFATSKNAASHVNLFSRHKIKCSLCKQELERNKLRSHFAGDHVLDFCTAIEDELTAAGLDDLLDHIKAYASVRRNNRTITTEDLKRFQKTKLRSNEKNKRLVCGLICEFDVSNDDCCLIHQKYSRVYERFSRDGLFKCPMCFNSYINMPAVGIGHLILEHSLQLLCNKYDCTECERSFNDIFAASDHVKLGHTLFCSLCSSYLSDVPSIREHLNRQHSSLVLEVADRLLRINTERYIVDELTSLCYSQSQLTCMMCTKRFPADAEIYEDHTILSHLGFRPMSCKWCQRPCTEEEAKKHAQCCRSIPDGETADFTCSVEGCTIPCDALSSHYKQVHWNHVKPVITSMLNRARSLFSEWSFILTSYRERIIALQLLLSTVSPAIVDEHCCQEHWSKYQNLVEHILDSHVPLMQPWFIFQASNNQYQRLACSLCETPVFETTWVCHVLQCHHVLLRDALDQRMSDILSLCGFNISFTPMQQLPVIKSEVKDEVVLEPMMEMKFLEELPNEEILTDESIDHIKQEPTEMEPLIVHDEIDESDLKIVIVPIHVAELDTTSKQILNEFDDEKLCQTPLVVLNRADTASMQID